MRKNSIYRFAKIMNKDKNRVRWDQEPKVWRPLKYYERKGPPGEVKLGDLRGDLNGNLVRPLLVFAHPARCGYGGEGEQCLLKEGHKEDHWLEIRMER